MRHAFVDKRAMITTALTSSCHRKTLAPFCLRKKRPENAFLTLTVNYRKTVQKNKLCHSKQSIKLAFNICYLVIGSFDWEIGIFQQTLVTQWACGRPKETFNGRLVNEPNETQLVRPNRTKVDVHSRPSRDAMHSTWTSSGPLLDVH